MGFNDRIIKAGGYDWSTRQFVNSFWRSSAVSEWKNGMGLTWEQVPSFSLPRALSSFGFVLCGTHLIIFGGNDGKQSRNDIHTLNLEENKGWKLSNIRCPIATSYRSAVTSNDYIHLVTNGNSNKRHFGIFATDFIPWSDMKKEKKKSKHKQTQMAKQSQLEAEEKRLAQAKIAIEEEKEALLKRQLSFAQKSEQIKIEAE